MTAARELVETERGPRIRDTTGLLVGPHICMPEFCGGPNGMRSFYECTRMLATSQHADEALIRSHIAYWSSSFEAEGAKIAPSRGHSYRVESHGWTRVVHITDHYDHREGVKGWR